MGCEKLDDSFYESIDNLKNLKYIGFNGSVDRCNLSAITDNMGFTDLTVKQTNLPSGIKNIYIFENNAVDTKKKQKIQQM